MSGWNRIKRNQRKGEPKKKKMEVIEENIGACGVDEIMITDRSSSGERKKRGDQINESCTVYRSKGTNVIIL